MKEVGMDNRAGAERKMPELISASSSNGGRASCLFLATAVLISGGTGLGHADGMVPPQQFARSAVVDNLFEIEAATLAQQRALGKDTKAFADDMIREHTPAGDSLAAAAKSQNVEVPGTLDDEHQKKLDALKVIPAGDFDQAYLSTQVTAHEETFCLFQSYAKNGPDGALRNAANAILPTLKMHNVRVHGLTSPK